MTQPLDPLLRDALSARTPDGGAAHCLDADGLAAWVDGTLTADKRRTSEAHLADCERCQMLLAGMARTAPAPVYRAWWRGSVLKWTAPLVAAAASAVVWLNLADRATQGPSTPPSLARSTQEATPAEKAAIPPPAPRATEAEQIPPAREQARAANELAASADVRRKEAPTSKGERQQSAALASVPAPRVEPLRDSRAIPGATPVAIDAIAQAQKADAPPAAPLAAEERFRSAARAASAPAAPRADQVSAAPPMAETVSTARAGASQLLRDGLVADRTRQIVIVSAADARVVWRISELSTVQRSIDGGVQWQAQTSGGNAKFNAGSSPSANVCWIVGSGGAVMLSVDGRTWQRRPFPETVELTAVTATDERSAVVTTMDGRQFTTTDAGRTWK